MWYYTPQYKTLIFHNSMLISGKFTLKIAQNSKCYSSTGFANLNNLNRNFYIGNLILYKSYGSEIRHYPCEKSLSIFRIFTLKIYGPSLGVQ